jgi:hypothetical protein
MRASILAGVLAAAFAAGGCGGDDPVPVDPVAEAAAVGTYTLTAANGSPLPFKYGQSDTSRFDIISGRIILEANHDMTDETTTTETRLSNPADTIGVEAVQRYLGSWSLRGDSVRLSYPGLGIQMAGLNGSTLTLAAGTLSLTYTK